MIDGRRIGLSPLEPVELSEGGHLVIVRDPNTGSWRRRRFTIRPGREHSVHLTLPVR